jgi:quinolinate synthase
MTDSSKQELIDRILALKEERKAVILAHNYQRGEVQDVADILGDSLELSRKAAESEAEVIVFCGVHFMAETAAILSPEKTVLLPVLEAGCPMADMVDAEGLRALREKNPEAVVVTYVNSSAAVKAESDICCTSANAEKIISKIPEDRTIIFVPDQHLGSHATADTGRTVTLWPGFCPTHARITAGHIEQRKEQYPDAPVVVHPECRPEVRALADAILSTGGICRFARESKASTIIVGTEHGILHRLKKENPDKDFVPACEQAVCPNMKLIRLDDILWSLEEMKHHIKVPEEMRKKAETAVRRMIETV